MATFLAGKFDFGPEPGMTIRRSDVAAAKKKLGHWWLFFFSSRRRHTRYIGDWSSDVCSSDLQADVMRNVVAAVNSSIQFNKKNFWIDPVSHNQYYVGVQYPEKDVRSLDTLLEVPITGPNQKRSEERRVGKEGKARWSRCQ